MNNHDLATRLVNVLAEYLPDLKGIVHAQATLVGNALDAAEARGYKAGLERAARLCELSRDQWRSMEQTDTTAARANEANFNAAECRRLANEKTEKVQAND